MDSFFSRYKNSLVLIAVVLVQTIALAVQVQRPVQGEPRAEGTKTSQLRHWMVAVSTPFELLSHGAGLRVRHVWSNYIDLRHARQENRDLQSEIARLRQEQAAFAEDAQQGRRLQAMLEFRQHYIATTVAAQIIGTSGTDRSRMVTIDKGYNDGLRMDQAVITPDGIVGKLREVFPNTAELLLINDPTAGAGVIFESSRIRGIVHGNASGKVQITNLTADSRIKPGEHVITSGGDQVFPRGLPVGVVESIAPDPDHQPFTAINIKPAADLLRLEEVLVVTGTQQTLPAEAQQDAAIAETTAADSKHAAQLAAERLPSATEAKASGAEVIPPDTVGGVPGVPNSGVPKPQMPVHPDHYSPGTTPRADQLMPGAPAAPAPEQAPKQP